MGKTAKGMTHLRYSDDPRGLRLSLNSGLEDLVVRRFG